MHSTRTVLKMSTVHTVISITIQLKQTLLNFLRVAAEDSDTVATMILIWH